MVSDAAGQLDAAGAARAAGKPQVALEIYRRLLAAEPALPNALLGAAICHEQLGQQTDAAERWRQLLLVNPRIPLAHDRLGLIAYGMGRIGEALAHFDQALAVQPDYLDAMQHRAAMLQSLRRYDEAIAAFERYFALTATPAPMTLYHYAKALKDAGRLDDAARQYEKAVALQPDQAAIRFSRGLLHLLRGDWIAGWADYEHRWQGWDRVGAERPPASTLPCWHGEPVPGGSALLVYAEQGMGDTLHFFRYAPLLRQRFDKVAFLVQAPLVRLLRANAGPGVIVADRSLPVDETGYSHHISLLSVAGAFGATPDTVPFGAGYLRADKDAVAAWRHRLPSGRPLIGVVWEGGKVTRIPARDMAPDDIVPLLRTPGIQWVSLLKDGRATGPRLLDPMAEIGDFADTAALIAALDLVIAVDTAVAHLAGALGKPVWLMNRFESEWRWMLGRTTTPWYDSMRLFSQPAPGDWAAVVRTIQAALPHALPR